MIYLWVAGLAVVGVILRYEIDRSFLRSLSAFPWHTFLINVAGSLIAGIIAALSEQGRLSPRVTEVLLVGFCGALTTFSAYSLQTMQLIRNGEWITALSYVLISPLMGVCAIGVGFWLAKLSS